MEEEAVSAYCKRCMTEAFASMRLSLFEKLAPAVGIEPTTN